MSCHVLPSQLTHRSAHTKVREAILESIFQLVILVPWLCQHFIEVPGRSTRWTDNGAVSLAVLIPECYDFSESSHKSKKKGCLNVGKTSPALA